MPREIEILLRHELLPEGGYEVFVTAPGHPKPESIGEAEDLYQAADMYAAWLRETVDV